MNLYDMAVELDKTLAAAEQDRDAYKARAEAAEAERDNWKFLAGKLETTCKSITRDCDTFQKDRDEWIKKYGDVEAELLRLKQPVSDPEIEQAAREAAAAIEDESGWKDIAEGIRSGDDDAINAAIATTLRLARAKREAKKRQPPIALRAGVFSEERDLKELREIRNEQKLVPAPPELPKSETKLEGGLHTKVHTTLQETILSHAFDIGKLQGTVIGLACRVETIERSMNRIDLLEGDCVKHDAKISALSSRVEALERPEQPEPVDYTGRRALTKKGGA